MSWCMQHIGMRCDGQHDIGVLADPMAHLEDHGVGETLVIVGNEETVSLLDAVGVLAVVQGSAAA